MTITQLKKEIFKAIQINKQSLVLNDKIDNRTIELLKSDYDDLKSFIKKCFKDYEGETMTKYKIKYQDTMTSYYLDVEFNSYDEAWDYMQENNLIDCYEID